jgi:hypothetical protein
MIRTANLALTCSLPLFAASVGAQSVNLDYGAQAGAPAADYAAAGLAGEWNTLALGPGPAAPLVDLLGQPTQVTVAYDFSETFGIDDPATSGDDARLFDDGIGFVGDVQLHVDFAGLTNGTYELITYGWTPGMPGDTTLVMIGQDFETMAISGGPWPGGLAEGVTHVVHEVTVSDGTLSVGIVGGVWGASGFANGFQLMRLTPADLDRDGIVGVVDMLAMLAEWGPCPNKGECVADLDGDLAVGVLDFLMLLSDWG